jgi:hypothetical protein
MDSKGAIPTEGSGGAMPMEVGQEARSERRLRLLLVRPKVMTAANAGDNIVHDAVTRHMSASMDVHVVEQSWNRTWAREPARLFNLLRCGPPEAARHLRRENGERLKAAIRSFAPDVICLNHEYTFFLLPIAARSGAGIVLYAHNVHSQILDTDRRLSSRLFKQAAARFERRFYGDQRAELVCISQSDARYLREGGVRTSSLVVSPGPPPAIPLASDARVERSLVITGSYGWWRKLRDLKRFAAEEADPSVECLVGDGLPSQALIPGARSAVNVDWGAAIRFGVLTDRFAGGFKLKSTEYIARNCVVLSFADISEEFDGLPHAAKFVRTVHSRAEAEGIMREMAASHEDVPAQFAEFKAACLARFDWSTAMGRLEAVFQRARPRTPVRRT